MSTTLESADLPPTSPKIWSACAIADSVRSDVNRLASARGLPASRRAAASNSSRDLMARSQTLADGSETGYAFGLRTGQDAAGRAILHHGGTSIGARAFLLAYPEARLSLSLLANGPAEYDEISLAQIADAFVR